MKSASVVKGKFKKRTYTNPGEFLNDIRYLIKKRGEVIKISRGGLITPAFRERLMLAVTSVNRCRYCTFMHTRLALSEGIAGEELKAILDGKMEGCPVEEIAALEYALHWAETGGRPDSFHVREIVNTYGENFSDNINLVLRMIRVGNLCGNTFDWLLYRVSFGLLGKFSNQPSAVSSQKTKTTD